MLQKIAQKLLSPRTVGPGDVRPAYSRLSQRKLNCICREIVELEVFFRSPLPVADVRLIPKFPVPRLNLGAAISCNRVAHPLVNQLCPFLVIARRIRPAGEDCVIGPLNSPFVTV